MLLKNLSLLQAGLLFFLTHLVGLSWSAAVRRSVPTTQVELSYYTYANNVLSGQIYIENIAYTKVVTVYYSTAANVWNVNGDSISASYSNGISGTNYEFWNFTGTIGSAGISEFYIEYTVSGSNYYDNNNSNNYKVTATSTTTTTTTTTTTSKSSTTTSSTKTTTTTTSTTSTSASPTGTVTNNLPWANRTIYQLLTDRFALTTDSTNGCSDLSNYCGGTFQGIQNHLSYIQGMGFDAIWISPIPVNTAGGYHGYWATDFYSVNPYFGTAATLKAFVNAAHNLGMYVMLDTVANHAGPTSSGYSGYTFSSSSLYHPQCDIDYNNQTSIEQCWVANNLPDINTENTNNIATLNNIISTAVTTYGFDGLRIDTFKHVRKTFWPGYISAAGVWATGEVLSGDASYVGPYQSYIPSLINYPLYYAILNSFGAKQSFTVLAGQITTNRQYFKDTNALTVFVDNHDNARFLSTYNDLSLFKNAITFMLLGEGVPTVYYGMEQAFHGGNDPNNREVLWPTGYNTNSEMYLFFQKVITKVRKVVSADLYMSIYVSNNVYAFRRGTALIILNNYGINTSLSYTITGLSGQFSDGTTLKDLFSGQTITISGGSVTVSISSGMPIILM